MPYIITTWNEHERGACQRRAVATLDEAQSYVERLGVREALDGRGGTVGPLPDGTVIEVERLSWDELRTAIPQALEFDHGRRCEAILDAYNAAQR